MYAIFFEIFSIQCNVEEFTSIFLSIILSVGITSFYMMILGIVTNRYMGDHIIVGTGMNILAPALAILLYMILSPRSTGLDVSSIIFAYDKNIIHEGHNDLQYLHFILLAVTIIILAISAFFLNKTTFGLRLKSSGENPYSLETAGVSVAKTRMFALWIAGLLSALAGVIFTTKGSSAFFFTVNGSGFLAIGVLILGQYKIIGTLVGSIILAIFIGLFNAIPFVFSANEWLVAHQALLRAIPFLIPIIGLMVFRKSFVPNAVGKNFKKDQR